MCKKAQTASAHHVPHCAISECPRLDRMTECGAPIESRGPRLAGVDEQIQLAPGLPAPIAPSVIIRPRNAPERRVNPITGIPTSENCRAIISARGQILRARECGRTGRLEPSPLRPFQSPRPRGRAGFGCARHSSPLQSRCMARLRTVGVRRLAVSILVRRRHRLMSMPIFFPSPNSGPRLMPMKASAAPGAVGRDSGALRTAGHENGSSRS